MQGITLKFSTDVVTGSNAMGDPILSRSVIVINDCLVEPVSDNPRKEQLAVEQGLNQVRVHIPKGCNAKLDGATFIYDGKVFKVLADSVQYIVWNTPTRWNRHFRAECIQV